MKILGTPGSVSSRRGSREPMPALWMTASKRPNLLASLATVVAPATVERSPQTAPWAPAAARRASRLRPSLRPCRTTSWPCSIRSVAATRPRPSDDPVMNTRATTAPPYRPEQGGSRRLAGNHLMHDSAPVIDEGGLRDSLLKAEVLRTYRTRRVPGSESANRPRPQAPCTLRGYRLPS